MLGELINKSAAYRSGRGRRSLALVLLVARIHGGNHALRVLAPGAIEILIEPENRPGDAAGQLREQFVDGFLFHLLFRPLAVAAPQDAGIPLASRTEV